MNKKYEPLDITGDVGLKAYGKTVDEVFINAAVGMYSLITNINLIKEKKSINISVESSLIENLFVSWLNELIFHFDTYGFIGRRIEIESSEFGVQSLEKHSTLTYKLSAKIYGEDFDSTRHESKLLIKAATYHKLSVEKINDIYEAEIIFDI
ncbi:MAG: archease [Thermodesulfovibrionia bacterium]|nr:archease [Thermodesulfovibrionia bacterium]